MAIAMAREIRKLSKLKVGTAGEMESVPVWSARSHYRKQKVVCRFVKNVNHHRGPKSEPRESKTVIHSISHLV